MTNINMQTFLPYPDFSLSAKCLDNKRLGKQRLECLQILNALEGISKGWINHPATKMWRGYEDALRAYATACVVEWVSRSFRNSLSFSFITPYITPPWLGDNRLHSSHRAALLYKDPWWYSRFEWPEVPQLDYWWPK